MNERIRELAGQVCDTLDDGDWNIPNEFIEKFAELIVRECADLLMQAAEELEDQSPNKGHFEIAAGLSETVKNHFGVEE